MEEHQEKMQSFEEVLISAERIIKLEPEEPDCLPQSHDTDEGTQVKPFEEILFSGTEDHAVKSEPEDDPLDCVLQNDKTEASINYLGQGVVTLRDAKHPQYASTSARLASYHLWPMSISQRPEELVEAGFYYTGRGDRVICFYCGGGLKDWGVGDRAWVEHAVWFQNCQYLLLIKGPAFVEQVRALREAQSACELQQFNQSTVNAVQPPSPPQAVQQPTQAVQQPTQQPISSTSTETTNQQENAASGLSIEQKPQEEASTAGQTEATEVSDDGVRACKVCFLKELGIVFLPCGHMATCPDCAPQLRSCPICRTVASAYIRAYLP